MIGKNSRTFWGVAVAFGWMLSSSHVLKAQSQEGHWSSLEGRPECMYWAPGKSKTEQSSAARSGEWSGTCRNGKIHGQGDLTSITDDGPNVISGSFDQGKLQGLGTLEGFIRNEDKTLRLTFQGQFKDSLMHGQGSLKVEGAHGDVGDPFEYTGNFTNGLPQGDGRYTYKNFAVIEGTFNEWGLVGKGTITYSDGDIYQGDIKKLRATGQGALIDTDGTRYEGTFVEGRLNGQGLVVTPGGLRMEGQFKNGDLSGPGYYENPYGQRMEGVFKDGWVIGVGKLTFPDGTYYEGHFDEDVRSGAGLYVDSRGFSYQGEFASDHFEGHGVFTDPDGNTCEGEWKAGVLLRTGSGVLNGKATPCIADERSIITFVER